MSESTGTEKQRNASRLSPIRKGEELLPWRHADELHNCSLYWLPVPRFPAPESQRTWLLRFLDLLEESLVSDFELRCETFVQLKALQRMRDKFVAQAREFGPMLGLSRRPGASLPAMPSSEDLEKFREGKKQFVFDEYVPDACYWFLYKYAARQRKAFGASGGLTTVFLKPDPGSKAPELPLTAGLRKKFPMFQLVDVDAVFAGAFALQDAFLSKSKELFGAGLESSPQYPGLLFILPLLLCGDFFSQSGAELQKWFGLFDVYINESPADAGVLLASRLDLSDLIVRIVARMRGEGLTYRE